MSFNRILVLLPDAFARIDTSSELTRKRFGDTIRDALKGILAWHDGQYSIEYRDNTLIIYTASAILKQYIHQHEDRIVQTLLESVPDGDVKKIIFKGPR